MKTAFRLFFGSPQGRVVVVIGIVALVVSLFAMTRTGPRYEGRTLVDCLREDRSPVNLWNTPLALFVAPAPMRASYRWVEAMGPRGRKELLRLASRKNTRFSKVLGFVYGVLPTAKDARSRWMSPFETTILASQVLAELSQDEEWARDNARPVLDWFLKYPKGWLIQPGDPTFAVFRAVFPLRFALADNQERAAFYWQLLGSPYLEIRAEGAFALAEAGSTTDKTLKVLVKAIEAGRTPQSLRLSERGLEVVRRFELEEREAFYQRLMASADAEARLEGAIALARLGHGTEPIVSQLREAIERPLQFAISREAREAALAALRSLPRDQRRGIYQELMASENADVRLEGAVALSRNGRFVESVASQLIEAIEFPERFPETGSARERAYEALRRIDSDMADKHPVTLTRRWP